METTIKCIIKEEIENQIKNVSKNRFYADKTIRWLCNEALGWVER